MVNKCVAPNCKTGLDGRNNHAISTFSFPKKHILSVLVIALGLNFQK